MEVFVNEKANFDLIFFFLPLRCANENICFFLFNLLLCPSFPFTNFDDVPFDDFDFAFKVGQICFFRKRFYVAVEYCLFSADFVFNYVWVVVLEVYLRFPMKAKCLGFDLKPMTVAGTYVVILRYRKLLALACKADLCLLPEVFII